MDRIRFRILLVAWALIWSSHARGAQRTFVSSAMGNDSNPCTRALPCRNFAAAIPQTDTNGEIIVLDSGGYGVVTINKALSIISPSGVHAAITAFAGDAILVDAGDTAQVVLRNLSVNSQGGRKGIRNGAVGSLHVENCTISGFTHPVNFGAGIEFETSNPNARLHVSHTTITRCDIGIRIGGLPDGVRALVDTVRVLDSVLHGVIAERADVTIRNSEASADLGSGFHAFAGSRMFIENSTATRSANGFRSDGVDVVMILTRSIAAANDRGIVASNTASTYVSDSVITGNEVACELLTGGAVWTRGNNTVKANGTDGTFFAGYGPD